MPGRDAYLDGLLEHDPEKWHPVSEKIMNVRAPIDSI